MLNLADNIIKTLSSEEVDDPEPYLEALRLSPSFLDILNKQISEILQNPDDKKNKEQEKKLMLAMKLISVSDNLEYSNSIQDFFDICCNYDKDFTTYNSFEFFQRAIEKCLEVIDQWKYANISGFSNPIVIAEIGLKCENNFVDAFRFVTRGLQWENPSKMYIIGLSILFEKTKLEKQPNIIEFVDFLQSNEYRKLKEVISKLIFKEGLSRQVGLRLITAAEHFLNNEDVLKLLKDYVDKFIEISTEDNDPVTFRRLNAITVNMPIGGENTSFGSQEQLIFCASLLFPHIHDSESELFDELVDFFKIRTPEKNKEALEKTLTSISILSRNYFFPSFVICQRCNFFKRSTKFVRACFNIDFINEAKEKEKLANTMLESLIKVMSMSEYSACAQSFLIFLFSVATIRTLDDAIKSNLEKALSLFQNYQKIFLNGFMEVGKYISDHIFKYCVEMIANFDDSLKTIDYTNNKGYNEILVRLLYNFVVDYSYEFGRVVCIITNSEDIFDQISLNEFIEHCLKGAVNQDVRKYLLDTENDTDEILLRKSIVDAGFDDDKLIESASKTILKMMKENQEIVSWFFEVYALTNQIKAVNKLKAFTEKKANDMFIAHTICEIANNSLIELAEENKSRISLIMTTIVQRHSENSLSESFYKSLISFLSSKIKTTEEFTNKIVTTPTLALIIPEALDNNPSSLKYIEPAVQSICTYINKISKKRKETYKMPDDQYYKWARSLFAKVSSVVDAKMVFNAIHENIKKIMNDSPMESLIFLHEAVKETHKREIILPADDPDIILKATEMALSGQPNTSRALDFLAAYFNLAESYSFDLLDIHNTLFEMYKENIPESIYQQLLIKCSQGIPKMYHAIIFSVLLEKSFNVVRDNFDAVCKISEKQETRVYNIYINSFSNFLFKHIEDLKQVLMTKQFTPFIKVALTRGSLICMAEEPKIFNEYMEWVLSQENITPDTIGTDFINVISEYDPSIYISRHFSGQFLVIISALIGLIHFGKLQKKKKQMYMNLQKATSIICELLSVPTFDIGDDLNNLANTCQVLAQSIICIPFKKVATFFKKSYKMLKDMTTPVLSSIGGVAIFVLSLILRGNNKTDDLKSIAIKFTQKAMANEQCCDFLYICAARAFSESSIDSLPKDIIDSYTITLGNCISKNRQIDEERIKLFYRMARRSKIAQPEHFSNAIDKCPEEGVDTLIDIKGKDALPYDRLFALYFRGITNAMKLIYMKAESENKVVIARNAVTDISLVQRIEEYQDIFNKTNNQKMKVEIIEWIWLFAENMSDEFLKSIAEKLAMFMVSIHSFIDANPDIESYVTKILTRIIIQNEQPIKE